jgi:hypothetical protein
MTDERQADRDAMHSAWRKVVPAMTEAGMDPDKLERVRNTPLTEREAAMMAGFMAELDEIISSLPEGQ